MTMKSRTAEDLMCVVEGMQFDRGYISPNFVTDPERMVRLPQISGQGIDWLAELHCTVCMLLKTCSIIVALYHPTL